MGEHVTVTVDDHAVATVRLDRPPVNAIDPQTWGELRTAAEQLAHDRDVGAVVLWGGPKVFAAGADIAAMSEMGYVDMDAVADGLQDAFRALARLPQIVIAAVNGYALGGGCELALTADFRFAADDAVLGQPEVTLGLIPGAGGTQRLARVIGLQRAKEMIYRGGMYEAHACREMGLVDEVHDPDGVYDAALAAARRYARGPYALRLAKQALDEGSDMDLETALRLESRLFAAAFATEDAQAGMRSFLDAGPGQATFVRR